MKIYEFKLKENRYSYGGGEYKSMVIIDHDIDCAITRAVYVDEYGEKSSFAQFNSLATVKEKYDITEIGVSPETVPRFVSGYYIPYDSSLDE